MKILAVDTSCDETAAAVTDGTTVLSNVMWSQASLHAEFGGVVPSVAQRAHEERIDWMIERALRQAGCRMADIEAVAVTAGPGLAIALGVGIKKAKELVSKLKVPLISVNHVEGHALSPLARARTESQDARPKRIEFPATALVASGKHCDIIRIEKIGTYKLLAHTIDDALGEALDKAARMLGMGYPGGAILEKMAKKGNLETYDLPTPMLGREERLEFSYSGLKTAMWRLVQKELPLTPEKIYNLAAVFQNKAFLHVERLLIRVLDEYPTQDFLFGGGVSANSELRKRVRKICRQRNVGMHLPYSKRLCGDNAAMIGVAAGFKAARREFTDPDKIDRLPRWKVDEVK